MKHETRFHTDALAEFLRARGIKQRWLAEQIGATEMQVSRWVRGASTIREGDAKRVALVLGMPFNLIFDDPFVSVVDTAKATAA